MKVFLIVAAVVLGTGFWLNGFISGGGFDRYLEDNFNPSFNAKVQYYIGAGMDLAAHTESAMQKYQKVYVQYSETETAPLALFSYIKLLEEQGKTGFVLKAGEIFLARYPDHPKAELVKRKMEIIKHGM